ncbi:hypothetical protein FBQ85_08960 [Cytophagia bacterium CHB2]|nr:hypothetical protein [Cytophagia bacterium CHB2]
MPANLKFPTNKTPKTIAFDSIQNAARCINSSRYASFKAIWRADAVISKIGFLRRHSSEFYEVPGNLPATSQAVRFEYQGFDFCGISFQRAKHFQNFILPLQKNCLFSYIIIQRCVYGLLI